MKLIFGQSSTTRKLKSDHIGIEMMGSDEDYPGSKILKSDHIGIEMGTVSERILALNKLKSDHIGIEMKMALLS